MHLQALLMFTSERERAGASVPRPRKVVLTLRSDSEVTFEGKGGLVTMSCFGNYYYTVFGIIVIKYNLTFSLKNLQKGEC